MEGDHAGRRDETVVQNGYGSTHQNSAQELEITANGFSHHPHEPNEPHRRDGNHRNGFMSHGQGPVDAQKPSDKRDASGCPQSHESFEPTPLYMAVLVFLGFAVIIVFGYLKDALQWCGLRPVKGFVEPVKPGWVPLFRSHERFYARHVFRPLRDCWFRPICGAPAVLTDIMDRQLTDNGWGMRYTGEVKTCVNMGSYNYLGFAQTDGPCAQQTEQATRRYGCGVCNSHLELGTTAAHSELNKLVAEFIGVESAMTFGMGFATNVWNIPALVGKGCLVLSDALNHTSMILGTRLSGANIKVFKHNDMEDLEEKLKNALIHGQPRTHRTWKKILILCEGIYSMEGTMCKLPELIALKKKYRAYLYLDEAHSIGALGPRGRGMCDYFNCDPNDVDVMMGTFSKSFAACGGYIAGSKKLLDYIRVSSPSSCYAPSMPVPVVQQIIASMSIIMGKDGTTEGVRRLGQLAWNSRYFRRRLCEMGFILYGNMDSPVVPLLVYNIPKLAAMARKCLDKGLAVVTIGFPATSIIESRARLCLSAEHTKEMLDKSLEILDEIGDRLTLKYSRLPVPDVTENDLDFRARYKYMPDSTGGVT